MAGPWLRPSKVKARSIPAVAPAEVSNIKVAKSNAEAFTREVVATLKAAAPKLADVA